MGWDACVLHNLSYLLTVANSAPREAAHSTMHREHTPTPRHNYFAKRHDSMILVRTEPIYRNGTTRHTPT